MKPINFWHGVILIISLLSVSFSSANEIKPIPSLKIILENTRSYSVGKKTSFHEIEYSIYPLAIKWYADGLLEQCDHHFLFNGAKIESPIQDISKS